MARIHKLRKHLEILSKYIETEGEYDVSSFEDSECIVVKVSIEVSEEDRLRLSELDALYDEDTNLWFVG